MKKLPGLVRRLFRKMAQGFAARRDSDAARIRRLRGMGVKIGQRCMILTDHFSTEPYLVEIGDHVAISNGVHFLTHDGTIWLLRDSRPDIQHLGKITVGDNTYIGLNSIILPGTRIGNNCIIGAGTVVRGMIPDNSTVVGNPGTIIGRSSLLLERLKDSPDTFDCLQMSHDDRRRLLCHHFGITG